MPDEGRLAGAVRSRRAELMLSQAELAALAHVSEPTIRSIEAGRRTSLRPSTRRDLAKALGWAPDSVDRVLAGSEPVEEPEPRPEPLSLDDRVAALDARLARIEAAFGRFDEVMTEIRNELRQRASSSRN